MEQNMQKVIHKRIVPFGNKAVERSETKETSQIISLPETICRSTEKLFNRPVTNCKPLKRGDNETLSRDGPPGIVR